MMPPTLMEKLNYRFMLEEWKDISDMLMLQAYRQRLHISMVKNFSIMNVEAQAANLSSQLQLTLVIQNIWISKDTQDSEATIKK